MLTTSVVYPHAIPPGYDRVPDDPPSPPPPEDPMGQSIGMEDPPTSRYGFFAPAEDDPYVPIALATPINDFMNLPVPPLCYPFALVLDEGDGPLILEVHFHVQPLSPITLETPMHLSIPVPSPDHQSDMSKGWLSLSPSIADTMGQPHWGQSSR